MKIILSSLAVKISDHPRGLGPGDTVCQSLLSASESPGRLSEPIPEFLIQEVRVGPKNLTFLQFLTSCCCWWFGNHTLRTTTLQVLPLPSWSKLNLLHIMLQHKRQGKESQGKGSSSMWPRNCTHYFHSQPSDLILAIWLWLAAKEVGKTCLWFSCK